MWERYGNPAICSCSYDVNESRALMLVMCRQLEWCAKVGQNACPSELATRRQQQDVLNWIRVGRACFPHSGAVFGIRKATLMERLSRALAVLYASKRLSEISPPSSVKNDSCEKERNAFFEIKELLTHSEIRKDARFNEQFTKTVGLLFDFINDRNADLRLISEQTLDSILRHFVSELSSSRVVVVLMSEIKRNGAARSLTAAVSRLAHVVRHVKPSRAGAIGVHLVSALVSIARRPEETVQSAIEKHLPPIFAVLGPELSSQRCDGALALYEVALENLELSGTANRAAAVIICQLSSFLPNIFCKAFKQFSKNLAQADDDNGKASLVGTLNSLRLLWPIIMGRRSELDIDAVHNIFRDMLRCVYSSRSEVVVASLELLERVLAFIPQLQLSTFFPQLATAPYGVLLEDDQKSQLTTATSACAASQLSSLRASPVDSIFDAPSPLTFNDCTSLSDRPLERSPDTDNTDSEPRTDSSCAENEEILDPLRHHDIFDEVNVEHGSAEAALTSDASSVHSGGTSIPIRLPAHISSASFVTYTSVLLARRFLLADQCLRLIPDRDARVSHKILAMNCLSLLAAHLPDFFDIPLRPPGGLGVQCLRDIELFLCHEDDQLKAATVTTIIAATQACSRVRSSLPKESHCLFKKCVLECMRARRAQCSRSLLSALKTAGRVVYRSGLTDQICEFACENYHDNYFLLRVAVAEYLASIDWCVAGSSSPCLPDEVIAVYLHLLADEDPRVRKAAADNLPILVMNANFYEFPTIFATDEPSNFICFSFPKEPLTVGLCREYNFGSQSVDFAISTNLGVLLHKLFAMLVNSADENTQAGLIAGLVSLAEVYPPSCYLRAWSVSAHSESTRLGLLVSLMSKGTCYCSSVPTFIHLFEMISYLFAGLNEAVIMTYMSNEQEVSPTSLPKLPDTHIMDQLILLPLRVMNLYYTLVTERAQLSPASSNLMLPRPTLSPVRKALPVGGTGLTSSEQRVHSISHLVGTSVKPSVASSFLLSSTLTHIADSLKGAYINYLGSIDEDVRERFTSLLTASLNALSCILEMALFSNVSTIIEEILLYCRACIDIAPTATIRLVTQLFKIVFGRNAANLSLTVLKKMHLHGHGPPRDVLEAYLLRTANLFTDFVVNSGRHEFFTAHLLRCVGWLRKDTIWKAHAPPSVTISPFIGLFEPFVSLTIRLYQSSSSYSLQTAVLNLICELVLGGINFSMLDPEMRLFNFVIAQVNEFGTRNWCNEDMRSREGVLLRSIFEFFAVLSHVENRGQMIIEPVKVVFFAEALMRASETKPHLAAHALNCLEIVMLDFIGVRFRFDCSLLKVMDGVESLARQCPTETIQLWGLLIYGAAAFGDEQNWSKVSLAFFETLLKMDSGWDLRTAQSAALAMRSCCSSVFRPIDAFFNKFISILECNVTSAVQRMLFVSPYMFMLLCVLNEYQIFPRIEQICDSPADKIARLLMSLLWECLVELSHLSVTECASEGSETELLIAWFLQMLSYALRSGSAKGVCALFKVYLVEDVSEIKDLSVLHPRAYAQLLAFYGVLGLKEHAIFFEEYDRHTAKLCLLMRSRAVNVTQVNDVTAMIAECSADDFARILHHWSLASSLKSLDDEGCAAVLKCCVDRARSFSSVAAILNVVELIEKCELHSLEAIRFLADELGESFALDERISAFFRSLLEHRDITEPEKRLIRNIYAEKANMLQGELPRDVREGRFSEVDEAFYSLNAVDPINFGSEALTDLLISSICSSENIIRAECISKTFSNFDADAGERILRAAYKMGRFDIISCCAEELENMKLTAMNCGDLYSGYSVVCLQKAQNLFSVWVSLAFDPTLQSPLQFLAQSIIAKRPSGMLCEKAASWASNVDVFQHWMKRYADYLFVEPSCCSEVDGCCIDAITFGISQQSFIAAIEAAQNSRTIVEEQLALAVNLSRLIDLLRMKPSCRLGHETTSSTEKFKWKVFIHDRTGRKDFDLAFFTDAIQTAFEVVLKMQEVFRKRLLKSRLNEPLERLAKAVTRLSFLNDISCIPRLALLCEWRVELEVHHTSISVPTVNIHYLTNVDVLKEFTWRISWAGWNRRANFDNFSMSLFGVLSSTPTGSELCNSSLNLPEQIMASAAAVDGLTNLLLESLLYAEHGNVVTSRFIAKHRDTPSEFLSSAYGQRMCMLKAILLGDPDPESIYRRNLELLGDVGKTYRLGQLSVHAVWNMTGVLDQERNLYKGISGQADDSPKRAMASSDSSYLLESGHDSTNESCLRMLFDTYSHWFRVGIDALPLPLLCATVKSMALLSDLFTDLDQYKFVFGHMKTLFNARSHLENFDLGSVIYSLMKCVAVLGIEVCASKADAQKALFSWVECGLTSSLSEIRVRTLQGILFLLQALSHDDLKQILVFVHSFITNELQLRRPGVDTASINVELESAEYETMLWTVGFYFCDNPLFSTEVFKTTFFDLVCESFTSMLTPMWLMDLLTSGIERLVVSSRIYILSFNRIAIQVLGNYFTMPNKFIFSLRIVIACLYHGMQEGTVLRVGLEAYDPRLHLMEQHPTVFKILAEGAEEDVDRLLRVLPYLLIDSLNQSEIINSILKELIHRYPDRPHPRPVAIFSIIHHWFSILHSRETESVVLDWTLNGIDSFKYVTDAAVFRFYVSAFLCSSAANPNIANLFHVIVGRRPEATWLDNYWFNFTVRSLLLRLDNEASTKLRTSMQKYIKNGLEYVDPERVRNYPTI
uniref:Huntingtin n=1 Tax=Ascaris suum TaxID=6253 RepID=F1KPL8_ASCSU